MTALIPKSKKFVEINLVLNYHHKGILQVQISEAQLCSLKLITIQLNIEVVIKVNTKKVEMVLYCSRNPVSQI